jgi:hypothetical protein
MKVKRRVQRGQQQRHDLAATPQRHAGGRGMIGACEHPRHADLHQRHQAKGCRKRHLKARMHQRFRRDPEHDQGRDRERTEGDGAAVDHDSDQHHRGHEERALGHHFRAREQQIKHRRR